MADRRRSFPRVLACVVGLTLFGLCSSLNAQTIDHANFGPGTEMTMIINRMGLGSDCGRCKALANEMDQGGPDWVRQNREYVVRSTISNASNLGHRMGPAKRLGVRLLVQRSIRKSSRRGR